MPRIHVLEEHVANQIAAGEVIERPASVVKELVENAIDAGSTQIEVRAEEAGLTRIEVRDNGSGIEPEECLLAFARHATSKIRTEKDLIRISSLGFRGEALASIASVSKVRMITATSSERAGVQLYLEGGEVRERQQTASPKGTCIQVCDLFYNTPARLKYLKSTQTELAHIHDVLARLALGHPDISFRFYHQGRMVFSTDGDGKLLHVIHALYGLNTARSMIPIREEAPDFELDGYVSKPQTNRASRSHIIWIVNGRAVKNASLTHALLDAYHTLLPQRRYPIAVVHLRMDPQLVDVNVHPAKLEVRFSKEQELMKWLKESVSRQLHRQSLVLDGPATARPVGLLAGSRSKPLQRREAVNQQVQFNFMRPVEKTVRQAHTAGDIPAKPSENPEAENPKAEEPEWETVPKPEMVRETQPLNLDAGPNRDAGRQAPECAALYGEEEASLDASLPSRSEEAGERLPMMYPLGQLHGTYILAQNEDGLYMVDQHAAQERIFYERFSEMARDMQVQRQPLMIPLTIHLHPQEASLLNELITLRKEEILGLGIEIEPFGQHTFLVRSYPAWVPPDEEEFWLQEMLQRLLQHGGNPSKISIEDVLDEAIMGLACKAAIKANRYLRLEEMQQLLDDLRQARQPFTCPHGRPVVIHFSHNQIKRMFKRIM